MVRSTMGFDAPFSLSPTEERILRWIGFDKVSYLKATKANKGHSRFSSDSSSSSGPGAPTPAAPGIGGEIGAVGKLARASDTGNRRGPNWADDLARLHVTDGEYRNTRRRVCLAAMFMMATAAMCPPWVLFFLFYQAYAPALVVGICFAVLVLSLFNLKHFNQPLDTSTHLLCGSVLLSLFVNSMCTGGFRSLLQAWVAIAPLQAGFIAGARLAKFYGLASAMTVLIRYVVSASDIRIGVAEQDIPVPHEELNLLLELSLIFGTTGVALLYLFYLSRTEDDRERWILTLSHDIRTPLHILMSEVSQLQMLPRQASPQLREHLQVVGGCTHVLKSIMDNMLVFHMDGSQISASQNFHVLERDRFIERILNLSESLAAMTRCRISIELVDDVPPFFSVNAPTLYQVLVNLLTNAMRFSEAGDKVQISISTSHRGRFLKIGITDNDRSTPRDFENGISGSFERSPGNMYSVGLDMAIVRALIAAESGARIWRELRADHERGALFAFELPMSRCDNVPRTADEPQTDTEIEKLRSKPVIVVSNSSIEAKIIEEMLQSMKFDSVSVSRTPADAVQQVAARKGTLLPIAVVFVDIFHNSMSGLEFARDVLAHKPAAQDSSPPPILIAVTGGATDFFQRSIYASGFSAMLTKPFSQVDLRRALEEGATSWSREHS